MSLQSSGYWDGSRKLMRQENGKVAIPVILKDKTDLELQKLEHFVKDALINLTEVGTFQINDVFLPPSKKSQLQTPYDKLLLAVSDLLRTSEHDFTDELKNDLPNHWEVHGDLVLLPGTCFRCHQWKNSVPKLWKVVATALGCDRVAMKATVNNDGFRTPKVMLLFGDDGWVQQVDNSIRFTYDVTKCMYSSGNITEKLRIANLNCEGEIVVDMYAGIGYFTLPYLVHARAKHVHACEWNPDAVQALHKNLQLNDVNDRCTVHFGDNRDVCPKGIADRVNLGLIPSSEQGWPVACAALNPETGGVMHIHSNVTTAPTNAAVRVTCPEQKSDEKVSAYNISESCVTGIKECSYENKVDVKSFVNSNELCTCLYQDYEISAATGPDLSQGEKQICQSAVMHNISYQTSGTGTCMKCKKVRHSTSKSNSRKEIWTLWAQNASDLINKQLFQLYKREWTAKILHIEHVKSYAPHVDHLVLDLECHPILDNII